MRLKTGVKLTGLRAELFVAIMVADQVYAEVGRELVITSVVDSKHSATSLHYAGSAFDCRIYDDMDNEKIKATIKERLGIDFDVILEGNHIHVEYQPRY